jgi:hypothetical protein
MSEWRFQKDIREQTKYQDQTGWHEGPAVHRCQLPATTVAPRALAVHRTADSAEAGCAAQKHLSICLL